MLRFIPDVKVARWKTKFPENLAGEVKKSKKIHDRVMARVCVSSIQCASDYLKNARSYSAMPGETTRLSIPNDPATDVLYLLLSSSARSTTCL